MNMSLPYETVWGWMLAVIGSVQFFVFILLVGIAYTFLKRRKVGKTVVVYKRARVGEHWR